MLARSSMASSITRTLLHYSVVIAILAITSGAAIGDTTIEYPGGSRELVEGEQYVFYVFGMTDTPIESVHLVNQSGDIQQVYLMWDLDDGTWIAEFDDLGAEPAGTYQLIVVYDGGITLGCDITIP